MSFKLPAHGMLALPLVLALSIASRPASAQDDALAIGLNTSNVSFGWDQESNQADMAEEISGSTRYIPKWGPVPVDEVRTLMDGFGFAEWFGDSGIKTFGWVEAGQIYSSSGSGLLSVQTRQHRYGDEFLMKQIALVIQKPLERDEFDLGFHVRYFAGHDAALGQPLGGMDSPPDNPRFSHDFRDLSLNANIPVLSDSSLEVRVGRMNTIIGSNGFLAPYRPFYSSDYQFAYSQDGAFTAVLTCLHVNDQLNIWNGMTLGANTFFTKRSENSYCYIGQINYWLQPDKQTCLTASAHAGPNAINAAPGLAGEFVSIAELRILHNWTERFRQVVQTNMGWDAETPRGTGGWYGLYTVGTYRMTKEWDALARVEWFRDYLGTRTGFDAHYAEVTLGVNWHPTASLEIRPEVRGDFADTPAFGPVGNASDRDLFTAAMSALYKY